MADTSQSILRRLRDLYSNPRGSLEQLVDQLNNFNKGRVAVINDRGAGYRNLSQEERVKQIVQGALDNVGSGGIGALGVIKTKGGNWLTGSVENALSGLWRGRSRDLPGVDTFEILSDGRRIGPKGNVFSKEEVNRMLGDQALNNWIEGPLTKYVKRDMATEGDPVRKLAEQGILHYQPHTPMGMDEEIVGEARKALGFPETGMAKSDLANRWEHYTDNAVDTYLAGNVAKSGYKIDNPWVVNVDPSTHIHEYKNGFINDIGFQHLTDELSNALNPESGLPRHLLLTPEQMQQMGMEKAVRHVADINAWRAAQKAEANLAKSQSPAVHLVREYAENNPKGLRWVELKAPKGRTPDEFEKSIEHLSGPEWTKAIEEYKLGEREEPRRMLQDALKYEGDAMGNCVGGYCDEVLSGRSRIFSLRDAKGEPHVTIETGPTSGYGDYLESIEGSGLPDSIVQIKGKANLAPKEEYLPFVQDFVKSGKWTDVGDLHNAGLYRHHVSKYPESVKDLGEYASKEDIENWVANNVKPTPGFAHGGSVQGNTTWRPMELDGIIGYITE